MSIPEGSAWKTGPWTTRYEFLGELGDGGQGHTFHARTKGEQSEVAVKILRSNRDTPKARRRMFREVNALHALSQTNARVPKFIESNIDKAIEDEEIKPYVAMEYIPGRTLLKAQKNHGTLKLTEAIEFANRLLDTIEIAHSEETTHRDIKPQNIVLKSDEYTSPYLIDFGLSFNRIVDLEDSLTSIRETIGNRFLTLPESEETGSDLKHEFASDLTLISGVLFFVLTNKFPEFLSREVRNSPHRRDSEIIESSYGDKSPFLMQFFDRAFQHDVVRRFQSSDELRDRLQRLRNQVEGRLSDIDPIAVATELRQAVAAENRDYQLDALEKKHSSVLKDFRDYVVQLSERQELEPLKLILNTANFQKREINDQEVIRQSILEINVSMPKYYNKLSGCRYFLGVAGEEIGVIFQEAECPRRSRNEWSKVIKSAPAKTLFNFYEWDKTYTESLIRHFGNWFERATRAIRISTDE